MVEVEVEVELEGEEVAVEVGRAALKGVEEVVELRETVKILLVF